MGIKNFELMILKGVDGNIGFLELVMLCANLLLNLRFVYLDCTAKSAKPIFTWGNL